MTSTNYKLLKSDSLRNFLFSCLLSVVPVLRLNSVNSNYTTQTLWAEDGLFTLCFKKTENIKCLLDGFSGYLQGLPRLTGLFASIFNPEDWALIINFQAVFIYVLINLFLLSYLGTRDIPPTAKYLLVMPPSLLAISGSEIIGVISNDYLILFYATLVYITFLDKNKEGIPHARSATLLFCILAISSPFGFLSELFLIIILFKNQKIIEYKKILIFNTLANALQMVVMISEFGKREQGFYFPYFAREVVQSFFKSFLFLFYTPKSGDFIPGVKLEIIHYAVVTMFLLVMLGYHRKRLFAFKRIESKTTLLFLAFTYFAVLFISVLSNGSPYRYLNLLMMINILIFVVGSINIDKKRIQRLNILAILILSINLVMNFEVSTARVSAPSWPDEWSRFEAACDSGEADFGITFSPMWPTINHHTYPLFEPLTNEISCESIK